MNINFRFSQTVETSTQEVQDKNGVVITHRGDSVRVLTLSGFRLTDPYILVTTDFKEGPGDFENAGTDIMVALDEHGREIPGVFSNGSDIWMADRADFRNWGLVFDYGWGREVIRLDEPNVSGRRGFIAYTRGRNEYLTGALCETEPRVQAYWLSCVREMIDAGVDGVDFRVENHSTMTDHPQDYGFNPVVMERCGGSLSVAQVRGEAYTDFLRQAKQLLSSQGKRMRINLNIDYFRPDPPACRLVAYPANIHFDWQTWIAEGLMDEGILRFFHLPFECIFEDEVAQEMIRQCREKDIPLSVNRYVLASMPADPGVVRNESGSIHADQRYLDEFRRVRHDGRFCGFVLYETYSFMMFDAMGGCTITSAVVEDICREVKGKRSYSSVPAK
jgi:hypothetical protein